MNNYQLNTGDPIRDQSDILLCSAVTGMKNAIIQPVPLINSEKEKVDTMQGITKMHCFLFPAANTIYAYETSAPKQVSIVYNF